MSFAFKGHGPLDYKLVTYEGSQMRFRGPQIDLTKPFLLCLGGSETFGKFVPQPYPDRLSAMLGRPVANMAAMNAGLELALGDGAIADAMSRAEAIVLQITGAHHLTNRFYQVHPRRNDRFLQPSDILRVIYREVDFTDFHFSRHMLEHLLTYSEDRFQIVVDELKMAWMARMRSLLNRAICPVHLLWIGHRPPAETGYCRELGSDPLFVTKGMLEEIAAQAASLTICVTTREEQQKPTRGMFFGLGEEKIARALLGPDIHVRAARNLSEKILKL
ncbi:hypothetical protein LSUCC1028_09310 [Rhodobacterales bacterium LSUCC1028]|jgi:hypothetical protein|uniref:DUF6473 family protein n=1 Tax=Roseobacter sp. HKCCA2468 TaxID=3120342 RepID=UPI001D78DBD6|nr:hypothetical protein [Rhodobacterales bacterium FZCC0188]MBF9054434.1 hypothetical protein [Rhodobacterales bacterium LSUCC1028]